MNPDWKTPEGLSEEQAKALRNVIRLWERGGCTDEEVKEWGERNGVTIERVNG